MLPEHIRESDWKIFRELREVALERFCARALEDVSRLAADTEKSARDRYADLYKLVHRRDHDLARAFDDPRRSVALMQLRDIAAKRLLTADELARFSPETRAVLDAFKHPG
jgi:hypothetical protein